MTTALSRQWMTFNLKHVKRSKLFLEDFLATNALTTSKTLSSSYYIHMNILDAKCFWRCSSWCPIRISSQTTWGTSVMNMVSAFTIISLKWKNKGVFTFNIGHFLLDAITRRTWSSNKGKSHAKHIHLCMICSVRKVVYKRLLRAFVKQTTPSE